MEIIKNKLIMIKEDSYEYDCKLGDASNAEKFIRDVLKLQNEPEEVLVLIGLDTKNNVVGFVDVARGVINCAVTSCREILKRAILMNCKKIMLTHNHPSGYAKPSEQDIELTDKLKKVCEYCDIELLDHIIIGDKEAYSLRGNRYI